MANSTDVSAKPVEVVTMYQHEETGQVGFVDAQQVEWGFFENNPRLHKVGEYVPAAAIKQARIEAVAEFLERTGQYVTNDASRQAAIVSAFDAAVAIELPCVSTVAYNSHEICKWFAENIRRRLIESEQST